MTRPLAREQQSTRIATNSAGVSELKRRPNPRVGLYEIKLFRDDMAVTTGDRIFIFSIPLDLGGLALRNAEGFVTTRSGAGSIVMWVTNLTTGYELLDVPVTIEANEYNSYTATVRSNPNLNWGPAPPTLQSSVSTGDQIAIRITSAGSGAMGMGAKLRFASPIGQLANPNAPISTSLTAVGQPNVTMTQRRTVSWGGS